ncbi:alcohol dehydrogenase [Actinoplanes sp. SE50]|uniref:zinc-dependent alcohol dehydrogenase n=1 Tax=unclassified Actinoplanes TaxID=2626549 RepID=UPI00023EBBBF|nr:MULTISPECIES: alcohol dehydrogenase catalytic domain-containing protein [unclassified Actinoplanes]AEV85068.1 alcohol dehydrogenase [Actinoplanes sp. SE50/110]ATO83459.1 alcohol dehydrogenase [Actinoplanes sp. SE50]SLM00866.1 alcohol dehydrogenase [Actinoplanes sp. SE50/110]
MKALIFQGPMRMVVEDVPEPVAAAGELLLRVDAVGICGSDVHGYAGETGRRTAGMVMGHEISATVLELGDGVTGWSSGDCVAVNPVIGCRQCIRCHAGNTNLCPYRRVIGVDSHYRGGYAEQIVVPAANAVPLEAGLWQGALIEPLAVGLQAVRQAGVCRDTEVAVLGAGMIGLAATWAAWRDGARDVFTGDLDATKVRRAERLGAVGLSLSATTLREALEARGVTEIARVVDAIGISATIDSALDMVTPGGTVCIVGMGSPQVQLPAYALTTAERRIVGSFCYSEAHFREAAEALLDGTVPVDLFIDREIGLDEAPEAFRQLASGERATVKTVIRPTGRQAC